MNPNREADPYTLWAQFTLHPNGHSTAEVAATLRSAIEYCADRGLLTGETSIEIETLSYGAAPYHYDDLPDYQEKGDPGKERGPLTDLIEWLQALNDRCCEVRVDDGGLTLVGITPYDTYSGDWFELGGALFRADEVVGTLAHPDKVYCPHCGMEGKVSLIQRKRSFHTDADYPPEPPRYRCSACRQTIEETELSLSPPNTKEGVDE